MITIDMTDDDEYYYIYAEFPGREKEIKIKFKGDKLSLKVLDDEDYPDQIILYQNVS
ncbi:MAG: hypothetical protein ACLRHW_19715 [Coprobacillus cateniformis]